MHRHSTTKSAARSASRAAAGRRTRAGSYRRGRTRADAAPRIELPFEGHNWGGRRAGAGRKPSGSRALHTHLARPERCARFPLHITTRVRSGLPSLRQRRTLALLVAILRDGSDRFGFRLIEYSVQSNHFHMLVEVSNQGALTRGTKGLFVRLARHLNRLWGRRGQVFPDRYHVRELRSPTEVRRALAYVLHNARRHGAFGRGIDPFSSGPWFDGFAGRDLRNSGVASAPAHVRSRPALVEIMAHWPRVTCRPRCWLLRVGWQRSGLIRIDERVLAWIDTT
ncbi:MAG: hypothetical protein FJ299_06795 [Planctomycetes bacterium]|nr:hypothetical protein [Planctomycetota bacterium]